MLPKHTPRERPGHRHEAQRQLAPGGLRRLRVREDPGGGGDRTADSALFPYAMVMGRSWYGLTGRTVGDPGQASVGKPKPWLSSDYSLPPPIGMDMNKAQLVEAIADKLGGQQQAAHAVDAVLDAMVRAVVAGERVSVAGIGSFERLDRTTRYACKPQTGERAPDKRSAD